jgi:hypothetical protein
MSISLPGAAGSASPSPERAAAPAPPHLRLTFLATGNQQHVFVPTDEPAGAWVYKVPAAFGYILPWQSESREVGRITSARKLWHALLVAGPPQVAEWLARRLRHRPVLWAIGWPARHVWRGLTGLRDAVLRPYYRRARARDFRRMIATLDTLTARGLGGVILPYRVLPDTRAILTVPGREVVYRGPVLMQRRADVFLGKDRLQSFDWQELVDALHTLWRHGFGLTEKGENLGLRSWALIDGHVRLSDTSSFTRSLRRARRTLSPASLDFVERRLASRHRDDPDAAARFAEYCRFVRAQVTREHLATLWNTAAGARR